MSKLELSEVGRRYLFLRSELEECPDLANDEEFMRRYTTVQRIYKHYHRNSRHGKNSLDTQSTGVLLDTHVGLKSIRRATDGGVI